MMKIIVEISKDKGSLKEVCDVMAIAPELGKGVTS